MALDTIGSIATHINENLTLPVGISGNMVEIVDMSRQHVANFLGIIIGSNSIDAIYQPAILDFANADTLDLVNAESGDNVSLAELSVAGTGLDLSARQLRMMAENKLNVLGRKVRFSRSVS